ncbi:DNA repair protein RecN [Nitrospirota bacterium]|nr:DNA repair protein RecN [Nitrospiraceae bacterium]GBL40525.1 DNA repair protein RecN [Nitrospirota bacterium]GDX89656.1 DNA repair protein RecN [Nitrospirota bacterium]
MLFELRIVNFALIEQLNLQFQSGFTVLTGETGAGKSLLIDAIALLVGGRASTDQIRSGEEEAQLEASFHLPDTHPLIRRLRAQDLIGPHGSELILRRVLSRSGRHRVYVNGTLCPLRVLEELGGTLIDIHGQHEQQSLLASAKQGDALDAFGRLHELRGRYEQAYQSWRDLRAQLAELQSEVVDRARIEDMLRFQSQEIAQACLLPDEEDQLRNERQRLVHAHRLRALAHEVHGELQEDEQAVLTRLGRIGRALAELAQTDPAMGDCEQTTTQSAIQLKDLAGRLRDYAQQLEADPDRQALIDDRLELIQRLKKKYGGSIEAVLAMGRRVQEELQLLDSREERTAELAARLEEEARRLRTLAQQLSKKRMDAAKRMTTLVGAELAAVKMEHAVFQITVSSEESDEGLGPVGRDRVEFLLSSNPGEPPRPLGRVASGGELSRIMLALKTVLAEMDQVPVLVFDEVDTGVGGAVAAAMGTRLRKLGSFHQVFCITHLPQVASQAEHHLLVEKGQESQRTATSVRVLTGMGQEEEIARMLGGLTITKKVRETAAELIAGAKAKRPK